MLLDDALAKPSVTPFSIKRLYWQLKAAYAISLWSILFSFAYVCCWHETEVPPASRDFRF